MRIHVTAVAGTGMGALAGLLRELGHEVSGSDVAFYPPMGPALREWGIRLFEGFSREHLLATAGREAPELVVVGNVCRKDNVEAVAALELGLPRLHIADALRRFALAQASPLVVAGTHGKTTTSALVAHLLDRSGLNPGFLIGGVPRSLGRSFRPAGKRKLSTGGQLGLRRPPFVLEGDEYDTAFWEKTAKFLHYDAEVAILTSIEHDHIDIYPTYADYRRAFETFVAGLPEDGLLVACASEPEVVAVAQQARCPVAYYALEGEDTHGQSPHWLAAPAQETEDGITFDLFAGGVLAGRYITPLPGRHNLKNAVAAIAAAAQGYGVPLRSLASPLAEFGGVRRRQELRGTTGGARVYDDFAHHPTAVRVTLDALRRKHREGRLLAVFEPRSATACRRLHQDAYADAFAAADVVLLPPVGRPELAADEKLDVELLASALRERGQRAEALPDVDGIVARLRELARPGDTVAILSNGAFGGIFERLLDPPTP
ncbi:MAG TPA: Mur ligase family protein [Polyangiaceae bacterium]|nr:Mur ligase family protein [Polyangiaceae bacterium]